MSTMKETVSLNEINRFAMAAEPFIKEGNTKFAYAIKQALSDIHKSDGMAKLHSRDARKARVNNAAVDEKGILITTTKIQDGHEVEVFKYTPAGQLAMEDEFEVLANKQYPFEAYCATDIPFLSEEQIKAFEGIVIPIGYVNPVEEEKELELTK